MSGEKIAFFRKRIIEWGRKNVRRYPWRNTVDPYRILVAEMLLQRTPPEQVLPVYIEFIGRFPTVNSLHSAEEGEVENLLGSLGLRWRIQNLKKMARDLVERYGGSVPRDYEDLKSLPGVSDYIASAVRCFAFGYPEVLLDVNTVRVTGRFFGLKISDSSRRSRKYRELLELAIDRDEPALFNRSLIDLGRSICRSRKWLCEMCPLLPGCALHSG